MSKDIKALLASRIKELRTERGLAQEQLAWEADVDRSFMCQVEMGRKNISIETLEKILLGLHVSPKFFFDSEIFNYQ